MKISDGNQSLILTVILALLVISVMPLLDDPFHKEGKVCFWTWIYREGYEILNGEQ